MERTKYIRPGVTVELSETAAMQSSTGDVYSAFTRNSYIARITFEDGRTVCVALPPGARMENVEELVTMAIESSLEMPDGGAVFL